MPYGNPYPYLPTGALTAQTQPGMNLSGAKNLTAGGTPAAPPGLAQTIPGLDTMTAAASGNILNLLNGMPSPSIARTANAYWGVGAGQPATGDINSFIGQRGTDLYGQQAQQYQQTGLNDLLSLIGGYAGTVAPTAGQTLQNQQFQQAQQQQQNQFDTTSALNQFNAQVNALVSLGGLLGQNRTNPFASSTPTSL